MSLLRTDVLVVAPSGGRWSVLGRDCKTIATFTTEEEAVAYAGFLARNRPVERVRVIDFDGSVATEARLAPGRRRPARTRRSR